VVRSPPAAFAAYPLDIWRFRLPESGTMKRSNSDIQPAADEPKHEKPLTLTSEQLQLILSVQAEEPGKADTADWLYEQDR
jgi:hypothetical protein